jgi:fructose-bisphosphate aldolase class 1
MTRQNLESIAESLVADGKGILAADETVPTLNQTIRHTRNWVDRAEPSHLPRNAF